MLLKISFIISLAGILILLLLSDISQPELIEIKTINKDLLNQKIQIKGNTTGIKEYNTFQILTIQDKTGEIPVLINKYNKLHIKLNQEITIIGRLTEYNKRLQVQADKILTLKLSGNIK